MSFSNMFVETVTSYGRDIDNLIVLIAVIVGFFWVICEGLFFYFIWRFRARPGHESQYVAGTTKEENKWITRTHNVVLLCDVVIIAFAISIWVNVKQTLPDPDNAQLVRVVGEPGHHLTAVAITQELSGVSGGPAALGTVVRALGARKVGRLDLEPGA